MNSSALCMMLITNITITAVAVYFFIKVLKAKPKEEPDSYSDKDEE